MCKRYFVFEKSLKFSGRKRSISEQLLRRCELFLHEVPVSVSAYLQKVPARSSYLQKLFQMITIVLDAILVKQMFFLFSHISKIIKMVMVIMPHATQTFVIIQIAYHTNIVYEYSFFLSLQMLSRSSLEKGDQSTRTRGRAILKSSEPTRSCFRWVRVIPDWRPPRCFPIGPIFAKDLAT